VGEPEPRRPAVAYFHVEAELKRLYPAYFVESPPARGSRLMVTGADHTITFWDMEPRLAARIEQRLSKRRGVSCSIVPYEPKQEITDAW
jgi:hypothetical protein